MWLKATGQKKFAMTTLLMQFNFMPWWSGDQTLREFKEAYSDPTKNNGHIHSTGSPILKNNRLNHFHSWNHPNDFFCPWTSQKEHRRKHIYRLFLWYHRCLLKNKDSLHHPGVAGTATGLPISIMASDWLKAALPANQKPCWKIPLSLQ